LIEGRTPSSNARQFQSEAVPRLQGIGRTGDAGASVATVPYAWSLDPLAVSRRLGEANDHENGWRAADFVGIAATIVDGIQYNVDIQTRIPPGEGSLGYRNDQVELAHARWAAMDAIAAIDLCAAALGRLLTDRYPRPGSGREMDFREAQEHLRGHLSAGRWVAAVATDSEYALVSTFRQAAAHRSIHRHAVAGRPDQASWLAGLDGPTQGVRALPIVARDVAGRHVEAFLQAARHGEFTT
jgi:hypothetical protein